MRGVLSPISFVALAACFTMTMFYSSASAESFKNAGNVYKPDAKNNLICNISESNIGKKGSREYAVMGQEPWSAFQCSSWASKTSDAKEQERLFLFGYSQGNKFFAVLRAKRIMQEDISREVPLAVMMLLEGPNDDFILGRIFEFAQKHALREVYQTGEKFNSDEVQKIIAGNKFRDGNCRLIGK
jgi:hypothetical protein